MPRVPPRSGGNPADERTAASGPADQPVVRAPCEHGQIVFRSSKQPEGFCRSLSSGIEVAPFLHATLQLRFFNDHHSSNSLWVRESLLGVISTILGRS